MAASVQSKILKSRSRIMVAVSTFTLLGLKQLNIYYTMLPLFIGTALGTTAIYIKAKNLCIRIDELLEIEQAYYRLLEKTGPELQASQSKSNNLH